MLPWVPGFAGTNGEAITHTTDSYRAPSAITALAAVTTSCGV